MTWAAVTAAVKVAAPYIAVGSAGLSAIGSIRQGQQQAQMYELQAQQAKLKGERDALQYEQQANSVLDRLLQTNAAAAAKGFAGGVSGFSGSAKLIQDVNAKRGGKDIGVLQEGAKTAQSFGDIQSMMLTEAADQAITSSYFDAFAAIGQGAFMYSQLGTGGAFKGVPKTFSGTPNVDMYT